MEQKSTNDNSLDLENVFQEIEVLEIETSAFFGIVSCCNSKDKWW